MNNFLKLYYDNYNNHRKRKNNYKKLSKEDKAKSLGNVICPKCGYQNHKYYAKNTELVIYAKLLLTKIILKTYY